MPPHFDDGGHLPFGGTIGNTRGPSAFGRRKATRANAIGNPQALLLNYPPENGPAQLACWERNYKSSIYMDASAEEGRMVSSNFSSFGKPMVPSYLAQSQQTWGNLRRTAFTRPTPSPAFYPPLATARRSRSPPPTTTGSGPRGNRAPPSRRSSGPIRSRRRASWRSTSHARLGSSTERDEHSGWRGGKRAATGEDGRACASAGCVYQYTERRPVAARGQMAEGGCAELASCVLRSCLRACMLA